MVMKFTSFFFFIFLDGGVLYDLEAVLGHQFFYGGQRTTKYVYSYIGILILAGVNIPGFSLGKK